MTWTSNNMNYYIEHGYTYTKTKDKFMVKIKDLPRGSHVKYPIICDICGETYYSSNNILNRSSNTSLHTCNKCKRKKSVETQKIKQLDYHWEKLMNFCSKMNYELITNKEDFKNTKTMITYKCPKHGIQTSIYNNLVSGHGCKKCAMETNGINQRNSPQKLIEYIGSYYNDKLLNPEEYLRAGESNLKILCGQCGKNVFVTSFINFKNGTQRCINCTRSISSNELKIRNILDEHNINYIPEKTFPDCKDKGLLFFDFYLPDNNMIIEFDGEQHYNNNFHITRGIKDPEGTFKKQKLHDEIKNQYCKDKGIYLLRIPYWEENHLEEIIIKELGILK